MCYSLFVFFFFKQKTAYELRISDWSSDVCSSDLRDFTYVDDIVEGVIRTLDRVPGPDPDYDPLAPSPATSSAPYRVYNIGNNRPVELLRYIEVLEECLGRKADRRLL